MATESLAPTARPADAGLRREVGLVGAIWASETSIIGSGWLFASLYAVQQAGTAALLGWVLGAAAIIILALTHSELGGMYPVAGGTARFPHFAFGSVAGISFGFFSWIQAITVAPIECYAVMKYGSYYWPAIYNPTTGNVTTTGFIMTIILLAIFTVVNFLAVRIFARVNSTLTWWKVAVPVFVIIVLLFKFHPGNFGVGGFMPFGLKATLGAIPGASIIFALLGFEQADQLAGEIRNPQRNVPRAIIGAVLIGAGIYILLQVAFIGALQPSLLAHHGYAALTCPATGSCPSAIADINAGPFAAVAGLASLAWLATLIRVDAFISPSGTGLMYMTATSRVGFGLARNRYYPQVFAKVDRNGVPWVSLILAFVFGLAFLLPFPNWHSLVNLITSASVLMYAAAPLSLGAFRRQVPEASRPYRLPGAVWLSPLAFVVANLIIYWSGWTTIWKLGIVMVIGYVLIAISMGFDKQRPPLEWKSAQWLPVYLIGMGIISWQGQYDGTNRIGFGWDMLVVAVFSLVIYYWAQASRLSRDEMLKIVGSQSVAEPGPEPGTVAA